MNLHSYSPATDTHEIRADLRGPFFERETVALDFPWFIPSVPTRYQRPNRLRRIATSPAANHLRAAANSAFYPAAIGAGLLLAFFLLHFFQGLTPVTGGIR